MRSFFAACLSANLLILIGLITVCGANSSSGVSNNQTPIHCDKMMVCTVAIETLETKLDNLISLETKLDNLISLETKLDNLIALIKNISMPSPTPPAVPASSCKELYAKHKSSKVFTLMFGSQKIPVYCHMGNFGCGDGGWTLAMKIDGSKKTFHFDSHFWSDKNEYNLAGGKTGFDSQETKLPTYWNTSFSKICLGMKIGQQINFIVINKQANSLYSLIADGQYRATSLGRNTWKTLIGSQASLQRNCNKEGFNAECSKKGTSTARIGFIGNNENDCSNCDSRLGLGTGGHPDHSNSCGNAAAWSPDNGDKTIKSMGYILVQ